MLARQNVVSGAAVIKAASTNNVAHVFTGAEDQVHLGEILDSNSVSRTWIPSPHSSLFLPPSASASVVFVAI